MKRREQRINNFAQPAHLLSQLGNFCLLFEYVARGFAGLWLWGGSIRIGVFLQGHRPVEPRPVRCEEIGPELHMSFAPAVVHSKERRVPLIDELRAHADEIARVSRLAFRRLSIVVVLSVSNSSGDGGGKVVLN